MKNIIKLLTNMKKNLSKIIVVASVVIFLLVAQAQCLFAQNVPASVSGPRKTITVISPNGGERVTIGSTYNITWSSTGLKSSDSVNLSLVDDDIVCLVNNSGAVAVGCSSAFGLGNSPATSNDALNTGSYSWNTNQKMSSGAGPSSVSIGPGAKYKIEICQTGTSVCDTSDNYFTVSSSGGLTPVTPTTATTLKVISPNGGDKIVIGSTYKITWSSTGLKSSDAVNLFLVDDDIVCPINNSGAVAVGCSSAFGLGNTTNTGSYSWNTNLKMSGDAGPSSIQLGPGAKYKIKICQIGTSICDISDNYFTVSSSGTVLTPITSTSTVVNTPVDSSKAYSIGDFELNTYTDSSGSPIDGALFQVNIQATSASVPFYKNVVVQNSKGVQGAVTIMPVSSNIVDNGAYFSVPANSTATINVQGIFSPSDLPSGNNDVNIYFPNSPIDSAPVPTAINGVCASTVETCSAGGLEYASDSSTSYNWKCDGSNGGKTTMCSSPIPPINFGICGYTKNECIVGTFNDLSDTATDYLWQCLAPKGGTKGASCSLPTSTSTTSTSTIATSTPVATTTRSTPSLHNNLPSSVKKLSVKTSSTCGGQITLSWGAQAGVTSYNVYRSATSDGTYTKISNSITNSYTDTVTPGTKFFYKITALNDAGESYSQSSPASATASKQCKADVPTTPIVTTGACGGQINLSWTPVTNADSYNIFRAKTATGGYSQIAKGITATTYTDTANLMVTTKQTTTVNKKKVTTNITVPGTFFYKISATNSIGTTAQSSSASATASGVCAVSLNAPVQPEVQVAQNSFLKSMLGGVWSAISSVFK